MHQHGYIGRKMRLPKLKENPALVVVTFGSSNRGKAALQFFHKKLQQHFPDYEISWAYTSEIIRKKQNLPSLQETLAKVESAGYRKAIVQPLHIFPGTEYQQLYETCMFFPGLRTIVGETLCHRWDFIRELLDVVSQEFLTPVEGLNLLALHGTPLAADPVNIVYLGLDHLVATLYSNVISASIEGIPDHEAMLRKLKREDIVKQYKRVKIIPMMYLAGLHVEEDLMGEQNSWRTVLEKQGHRVECPTVLHNGQTYFKGLAFYPECVGMFMVRIERVVNLMNHY